MRVATLSYGIYLIHIPVLELVVLPFIVKPMLLAGQGFTVAWTVGFLTAVPMVISVAYILHLMVEKPMFLIREKLVPAKKF